jgi:hypothetical protein
MKLCKSCHKDIEDYTDYVALYGLPHEEDWQTPDYYHFECQMKFEHSTFSLTAKGRKEADIIAAKREKP